MRTEWFKKAGWGIMIHFLTHPPGSSADMEVTVDEWNSVVDNFDVDGLADQLAEINAGYLIFTIGQNSGFYNAPNSTYDGLVGRVPSRCTTRDLIADIASALSERSIRTIAYLPSNAPVNDRQAVEGLGCTPDWDGSCWGLRPGSYLKREALDEKLSVYQRNWESIIREWSLRWGDLVSGWWFDGCYYADRMYNGPEEPNFKSFAAAARAGNENSIVAFNGGVFPVVKSETEFEDYTAGEQAESLNVNCDYCAIGSRINGKQLHVLTFLGPAWCGGTEPRFAPELTLGYTKHLVDFGGVVTWDVPTDRRGAIPESFMKHLRLLKDIKP